METYSRSVQFARRTWWWYWWRTEKSVQRDGGGGGGLLDVGVLYGGVDSVTENYETLDVFPSDMSELVSLMNNTGSDMSTFELMVARRKVRVLTTVSIPRTTGCV